jgi:hypothetical protein
MSYHDRHLEDDFIPLTIKIFGYLDQQADDFLHQCVSGVLVQLFLVN